MNPYIKSAINKLEATQVVHKRQAYKPHSKCPCGSGRKFRKCCMLRLNRGEGLRQYVKETPEGVAVTNKP